jgi:hypothetical protein
MPQAGAYVQETKLTDTLTPDSTETVAPVVQETTPPATGNESDLPEWAKTKISELNAEAAKWRVEKNNALANAKTLVEQEYASKITEAAESYAELEVKFAEKSSWAAKLEALLDPEAGIPADRVLGMASLVQGSTEEEISKSVATIKDLFSKDPQRPPLVDHTQGKGSPLPLNGDPLLNSLKEKLGIR